MQREISGMLLACRAVGVQVQVGLRGTKLKQLRTATACLRSIQSQPNMH